MAHVILVSVSSPKTPFIYLGMPLKNASYLVTLSKKVDPPYFLIVHEIMPPNFFWGPLGLRKGHFFKKPDMSDLDGIRPLFILGREVGIHAGSFLAN